MNVGISVSRVGGAAQTTAMKQVAGQLRLDLAYYKELQAFAQFATELDKATRAQLARGERMMELLKQPQYQPMPMAEQVVVIFAGTQGYTDELPLDQVAPFGRELVTFVRERHPRVLQEIRDDGHARARRSSRNCRAGDRGLPRRTSSPSTAGEDCGMRSTRDILRKIRTVRSIEQICRAMKTVASIRLRRAEQRLHRGAALRE